jgi:P-type Cu2+ transporter
MTMLAPGLATSNMGVADMGAADALVSPALDGNAADLEVYRRGLPGPDVGSHNRAGPEVAGATADHHDRAGVDVAGATAATADARAETGCAHCGLPTAPGQRFCCAGCAAAFDTIHKLGLGSFYQRCIAERPPKPEPTDRPELTRFIAARPDGGNELVLAIDGLRCGACVWLIESILGREPTVITGRVNMTTRRLKLVWRGPAAEAERLVERIESLGYRLVPFDPAALAAARDETDRALIRALAVAGFAAINVMLMSIGIWAGDAAGLLDDMGPATRDLLHLVSALIALPAIVYAGQPFFRSALAALRHGRTNMDVPIGLGVALVTGISVAQTFAHARDAYFDSAIMLLFFLLIGRVLDHRARGHVRATAELLLTLRSSDATVLAEDGGTARRPAHALVPGDRVLVGMGERIGGDGVVERGASSVDTSLVSGESLPVAVRAGTPVFAGTTNLAAPLTVRITATENGTLLAECARLIEASEARRSRFVVLADRVARRYAPAVHVTAAATFLGWYVWGGASLSQALLTASAVLIVTCPCALALAVPAVQVIATSRLFRVGVLLKSGTALERLAEVDTVVFDKTGTLTEPSLALARDGVDPEALRSAAALAAHSRHPLARALVAACDNVPAALDAVEYPGLGVSSGAMRLGSAAFAGVTNGDAIVRSELEHPRSGASSVVAPSRPVTSSAVASSRSVMSIEVGGGNAAAPELWLSRPGLAPVRFTFAERPRFDAAATVARLRSMGLRVRLLSGDRAASVAHIGAAVGIDDWRAQCSPVEKVGLLRQMGGRVLMVGDGLNDGPCLADAHVSASPASAADIAQTMADVVFQGAGLGCIADLVATARRTRRLMRGNIAMSIVYNALMVPLAVGGVVTPWLAAAAMSGSSLLVISNSFRAARG